MSEDLSGLEIAVAEQPTRLIPLLGQVVDLTEPRQVAEALDAVRDAKRQLDEIRALFEDVLRLEAQRQGTKTLHLGGVDAVVSGGEKAEYDTELLTELLRRAGLPEERLSQAVVETVSYKVDQRVLRSVAGANPKYAEAIEAAKTMVATPWYVAVKPAK